MTQETDEEYQRRNRAREFEHLCETIEKARKHAKRYNQPYLVLKYVYQHGPVGYAPVRFSAKAQYKDWTLLCTIYPQQDTTTHEIPENQRP